MPKCNECQYLTDDGDYEYPEYCCRIFGPYIPDKYVTRNFDGCKCTQKFLKKLNDEEEELIRKRREIEAEQYERWKKMLDKEMQEDETR